MQKDLFLSIPIEEQIAVMNKKLASCFVESPKIVFSCYNFTQSEKDKNPTCCHYTFIINNTHEIKMTYNCSTQKIGFFITDSDIFALLSIDNSFMELSKSFRTVLDDYGMNSFFNFLRQTDNARYIDPVAIELDLNSDEYYLNGYFYLMIDSKTVFVHLMINTFKKENIFSCRYAIKNNNKTIHNNCAYSLLEQCFYDIYLKKAYNISRRTKNNLMLVKMQAH